MCSSDLLAIDPSGTGRPSAVDAAYQSASAAPIPVVAGLQPIAESARPGDRAAIFYAAAFGVVLIALMAGWTVAMRSRRRSSAWGR